MLYTEICTEKLGMLSISFKQENIRKHHNNILKNQLVQ